MKHISFPSLAVTLAAILSPILFGQQAPRYPDLLKKIEESDTFAPMFAFQPSHACPNTITNVRTWPHADNRAAGSDGFIQAQGDHFVDGNGHIQRFIGTNICFTGCFPTHEDAEKVAAELSRYGINAVRLHYVHHKFPPQRLYPEPDSFLEPDQLERFDYLFNQLKQHGIYTYFQLNIGRKFGAQNGFVNANKLPWYNNGIDNAEPRMIELHKKFVSDILNHVNPYTHLPYKDDPAIAMLEIANENSIVNAWFSTKYDFPHLVEPYATQLKRRWNTWLKAKYGSTDAVKAAWQNITPESGRELIPDGIMSTALAAQPEGNWGFQQDGTSQSTWHLVEAAPEDQLQGKAYARLTITKIGATPNMPQFYRNGLAVKKLATYTLALKLRTATPSPVSIRISQHHDPWHVAGFRTTVSCTPQWQTYSFAFTANMDDDNVRLVIANFTPGIIDVADVSLKTGAVYDWPKNASLEEQTIDWPYPGEWSIPLQRAIDFTTFLGDIEADYFSQLRNHLKNNVGVHQPVTGTQLHYGFFHPQAAMDFCDNHSYWNHPVFPATSWDSTNWHLRNISLANGNVMPGTNLASLARERVLGKPLTISEYDHPNTNFYSAEGDVMLAAMAAFQNWSGIFQFAWTHSTDFFRHQLAPMFDLCSATHKLVHFPACYAMFVRGDVKSGTTSTAFVRRTSRLQDIQSIANGQSSSSISKEPSVLLSHLPLAMVSGRALTEFPHLFDMKQSGIIQTETDIPETIKQSFKAHQVRSSTHEITWNWEQQNAGFFMVDTTNTKVFSGFVRGRSFPFTGMTLIPGKSRLGWLTVSLTNTTPPTNSSQGTQLQPGRYLLAATGLCHNTDAVILDMQNQQRITPAQKLGGNIGTAPILCEGIQAELRLTGLARRVECHALDEDGNRKQSLPISSAQGTDAIVILSPTYKTVWYELIIQ